MDDERSVLRCSTTEWKMIYLLDRLILIKWKWYRCIQDRNTWDQAWRPTKKDFGFGFFESASTVVQADSVSKPWIDKWWSFHRCVHKWRQYHNQHSTVLSFHCSGQNFTWAVTSRCLLNPGKPMKNAFCLHCQHVSSDAANAISYPLSFLTPF